MKHIIHPAKTLSLVTFAILGIQTLSAQTTPTLSPESSQVHECKAEHKDHHAEKLENLSEAEKEQFKAAATKVHGDPTLISAKQEVKDAQTKEAREAATLSLHQVMHDLILKADPSMQPILDKIKSGKNAD